LPNGVPPFGQRTEKRSPRAFSDRSATVHLISLGALDLRVALPPQINRSKQLPEVFSSAAGLLVLFRLFVMATVGGILAAATRLSTLHKDVLVGVTVGFPSVVLLALLGLMCRAARG
jgi:hypothetical protein